ncbi:MAG TPA: hypothetical protein VKI20_05195 [Acidimicrobiales bacterium]|nr:hypothetical protein [Acidimicrobiales bacterium]
MSEPKAVDHVVNGGPRRARGAALNGDSGPAPKAPFDAHEWVSFEDPEEERTWVFDVTFLLSRWTCIFGQGCQGVLTGPAPELEQGCCSYGAHFTDKADAVRVERAARTLTPEQWQFRSRGMKNGKLDVVRTTRTGEKVTRLAADACIFLNRPGFPGGAGCALHRAALERRGRPLDLKPNVCWQLPIRREDSEADNGHVVSTVRQWDRRHWGAGGKEFHWWCTGAPEAFVGAGSVFVTMRDELVELVGRPIYDRVARYLRSRQDASTVPLPHPTVRRKR